MTFESRRIASIASSPSMAISVAARRLIAEGGSIIDLSLGEPDFDPPGHVAEAARAAIAAGGIRYTPPAGILPLRTAIAGKLQRENGLRYDADAITVANGAKQILFNALLATLEPGDEVVIPTPCWVSYGDMVRLHGGVPVLVPCGAESGFKLSAGQLEAALTARTRWLILNSPSNPTGALYAADELRALGAVLAGHERVLVMSDEIYEHVLLTEAPFISFASACPDLAGRTLLVNGVSKAYAMTGWRVGYAAGPAALIAAMNKVQSQSVTSVCSIAQAAALAALTGDQACVGAGAALFRSRAALVEARLKQLDDRIGYVKPGGAFYAFVGIGAWLGTRSPAGRRLSDDAGFASCLLEEFGVATVPGTAFHAPGYVRFSIAASESDLSLAFDRFEKMLNSLETSSATV